MDFYEFHDAANIFPMEEETLDDLAADIKANGLQCPIELLGGKILDGRRRYMACRLADVDPDVVEVSPDDPIAYVMSLNLHRRHLTPSQRAMVGARVKDLYESAAKQRQGKRTDIRANLPECCEGRSRDAIGKDFGVSGKLIDHAKKVIEKAEPEIIKAVDEGRMAVSTAAIHATDPPDVQREIATDPKRNRKYQSVSRQLVDESGDSEPVEQTSSRKSRGVGVELAHEAIACLKQIPQKDALRRRGFQIVSDWINHNK